MMDLVDVVSMRMRTLSTPVVARIGLLVVVGALVACPGRETAREAETQAKGSDAPMSGALSEVTFTPEQVKHGGVRWGPVAIGSTTASATVPGQLAPNEDRTARLGAPGRGRVVAVRVAPGDRVKAGQPLVILQSPEAGLAQSDLAKAEAEVSAAQAQATYATSARNRAERLLVLKAIPRQDYERAVADNDLAQSALRQAEAELRRARGTATALDASGTIGGEIVLGAPRPGVVLARTAVPGEVVEAGAALVVVTDPSTLWLTISAPETMAGLVRVGAGLRFVVPAYPADTFVARIQAVGAGLDPATRTLPVRGIVENRSGRLKPQMIATVHIKGAASMAAALLPDDAVQTVDGKPTVFLARPDGKGGARFKSREVEVGGRSDGRVAVMRGLAAGDIIVLQGAFAVKAQLVKATMPDMEM
jgi:cobalt-zinc-cadmium efflux system membrane fusion protein